MMSGVLGIETIVPKDEGMQMVEHKGDTDKHVYGLDHKLFTSEQDKKEYHKGYMDLLKNIDSKIKMDQKALEYQKQVSEKLGKPKQPSVYKPPQEVNFKQLENKIQQINDKHNSLNIKIECLKEKEGVFSDWMKELDDQQRIDIKNGKWKKAQNSDEKPCYDFDALKEEGESPEKHPQAIQSREKMIAERNNIQREEETKKMEMIKEAKKLGKKEERKKTYPICMEFYEPFNIAVFALVSKEIQIHQVK